MGAIGPSSAGTPGTRTRRAGRARGTAPCATRCRSVERGGPVLAVDGLLFVPTGEVWNGPNRITALEVATGELVWAKDFPPQPIVTSSGKGLLFVGTFGGTLYALRAPSGQGVWAYSTP